VWQDSAQDTAISGGQGYDCCSANHRFRFRFSLCGRGNCGHKFGKRLIRSHRGHRFIFILALDLVFKLAFYFKLALTFEL